MNCPNCDTKSKKPRYDAKRFDPRQPMALKHTGLIIGGERQYICPRCAAKFWITTCTQTPFETV